MAALVYPKWFMKSKTIIFNVLSLLVLAMPFVSDFLTNLMSIPELQPTAKLLLSVVAVVNIFLRLVTKVPVSSSRHGAPEVIEQATPAGRGTTL